MRAVGLDIGHSSVKAVLLGTGLTGTRVLDVVEIPRRGRSEGEAVDEALRTLGGKIDSVCVGLDRAAGLFRTLSFPFSDPVKIAQAAPFAAEEVLPVALDRLAIAHLPSRPDGRGKFAVPVHAIPREQLTARQALVAGHAATSVQIDAVGAVETLLAGSQRPERGKPPVLLIDIGASKTCLEVVTAEGPVYSRSLRLGTERMAAAVAGPLGAAPGEEEASLRRSFSEEAGEAPEAATRALLEIYERLAAEIQRTVLSAGEECGVEPTRVMLSGGGARLRMLGTFLSGKLGRLVELLSPPELASRGQECPERLATAYGLALVAAERSRVPLDLGGVPRSPAWQDPWVLVLVVLALMVAGGAVAGRLWLAARRVEAQAAVLQDRAQGLLERLGRPADTPVPEAIRRIRELLKAFGGVGRSPLQVLDALSEAIPVNGDLRFRVVTLTGSDVRIEAEVEEVRTAQEFEAALEAHEGFTDVTMTVNQQGRPGTGVNSQVVVQAKLREEAFR